MRKDNEKDQAFIEEVKQKLDWYINDAPADEYDEKAVASLEYLLETLEPTDDFKVDEEKAWVEFKKYVSERQIHNEKKGENPPTTTTQQKGPAFLFRHKGLVAAAILVLLLAVSISTSSEAVRDNGFFHWIKEMTGGRKMITVPEDIGASVKSEPSIIITDRNEIPDEWQEWSEIESGITSEIGGEWKYIEVQKYVNRTEARSHYNYNNHHVVVGILDYTNAVMQSTERYDKFDCSSVKKIEDEEFYVSEIHEDNVVLYRIDFFEDNYRCYVIGAESVLDKLEELVVKYKKKIN